MPFVPKAMLERLLVSAGGDDNLRRCSDCGAWFYADETGVCSVDEFEGCWFAATRREQDANTCFRAKGAYRMTPARAEKE